MLDQLVKKPVLRAVLIVAALNLLGACAANPGSGKGVNYAVEAEAERQALDKAGFPQYTGGGN